jgi:hypothetical protein
LRLDLKSGRLQCFPYSRSQSHVLVYMQFISYIADGIFASLYILSDDRENLPVSIFVLFRYESLLNKTSGVWEFANMK